MTILEEKLKRGYGTEIIRALAHYLKLQAESIRVQTDPRAPTHSLVMLYYTDPTTVRMKLRLKELERFQKAEVSIEGAGTGSITTLRIDNQLLDDFTQAQLGKMS